MTPFADIYRHRTVMLTGHTGFKGSWLTAWLKLLQANVVGVALEPPTKPSHWDLLQLDLKESRQDIRNAPAMADIVRSIAPEVVFHLAAQPLVRRSYRDPLETWSTNVMGTANILEACRAQPTVRAIVIVTTDKCYQNREWEWGYREIDRLGGRDPYSASKASAELLVQSYREALFSSPGAPLVASARAGNVIGGGDWSEDRLIPDLVLALSRGEALSIRSPAATRPWQHVLEPLAGYLSIGQKLLEGRRDFAEPWNFGPNLDGNRTVEELLTRMKLLWPALQWNIVPSGGPPEAKLLQLDSTKAHRRLGWRPVWNLDESLAATAGWYRRYMEAGAVETQRQISAYVEAASRAEVAWAL